VPGRLAGVDHVARPRNRYGVSLSSTQKRCNWAMYPDADRSMRSSGLARSRSLQTYSLESAPGDTGPAGAPRRGNDLADTDSDTWRPGVEYFDVGCGVERRRVSIERSATFKMEPPQLGRSSRSRGVCFICQHVSYIYFERYPFQQTLFRDQA